MRKSPKLAALVVISLALVFSISPALVGLNGSGQATVLAASNWAAGVAYNVGDLVVYQGSTYKCLQAHTSQVGWEPPNVPALWQLVSSGATPTPTTGANPTPTKAPTATAGPTATPRPTNTPGSGGTCTAPVYSNSAVYTNGMQVTYNGYTWQAKWWTQGEAPSTGGSGVWQDFGPCSGGPTPTPTPTAGPTPTPAPGGNFPGRVFAPYVDVSAWPTFDLVGTAQNIGVKYFTLAFVIGGTGGCQAAWGGSVTMDQNFLLSDVASLRSLGGDVIGSFGGAAGTELAQACTSDTNLKAQYQAVISKYNLTQVDFDIEGAAVGDTAANDRRARVLASLQADARRQGKQLKVSFTLPVLPSGLDPSGVNIIKSAIANGLDVSVVNIMAMDYGSIAPPNQMGANATQAATSTFNQIKPLYPGKTDAQLWAMIGITPMIGMNDVSPEVFTLSDAQQVLSFAQQNNVGRLAFWSEGRDKQCPGGAAQVSPSCSGIAQSDFAFSNVFKPFTR